MSQSQHHYQQMKQNIDSNIIHQKYQKTCKKVDMFNRKSLFRQINQQQQKYHNNNNKNKQQKTKKCLAYIVDSQQQQSKLQISQIHQRQQQQQIWNHCQIHKINMINYHFCVDCCSYNLCIDCVSNQHKKHTILTFQAEKQAKSFTKQFLIQKVQQSLIRLKRQQNQIKNRANEIDLILKKVHEIQTQLISQIQQTFSSIQKQIRQIYQIQQKNYIISIQQFYKQFNKQGDDLRQSLLSIIQQTFDVKKFNHEMIDKIPPSIPSIEIDKFKAALEKTKKFNKIILDSLNNLKQKGKQFIKQNQKYKLNIKSNKSAMQKYQKFLMENCYGNQNQNKSSLLKILDTFHPY